MNSEEKRIIQDMTLDIRNATQEIEILKANLPMDFNCPDCGEQIGIPGNVYGVVSKHSDGSGHATSKIFRTSNSTHRDDSISNRQRLYPAIKCLKCGSVFKKTECWTRQVLQTG